MSYSVQNIRNVCLLGHSGSGKTSLAENLLFITGAIERQGRVADGNTVCDYDPEEVKRQISLSTAVAPIDYKGCRINVLDTPGAFDFSGEVMEALIVDRRHSGGQRDLTLDLFGIVITNGIAVRDSAHTVDGAGHIQKALCQSGFAAAAMAQQADITNGVYSVHSQKSSFRESACPPEVK